MNERLIDKLLNRLDKFNYPENNPNNKKPEKLPLKYLFTSTEFIWKKDVAGVMQLFIKGTTCKRNPPKLLSRRDFHRQKGIA